MSSKPHEPHLQHPENDGSERNADEGAPGVETTTSDDGGSTFEPEEDPEGHGSPSA